MADAESRAQRAAALEEKRRKLDELKKKRALRADTSATRQAASANLDEYIDGLLQEEEKEKAQSTPSTQQQQQQQQQQSQQDQQSASAENDEQDVNLASLNDNQSGVKSHGKSMSTESVQVGTEVASQPAPKPRVETFTVSTQTEFDEEDVKDQSPTPAAVVPDDDEDGENKKEAEENERGAAAAASHEPALLSADQVAHEVTRTDFGDFLTNASKKVERLLGATDWNTKTRLLLDPVVASGTSAGADGGADASAAANENDELCNQRVVYEAGKWTASRDVTDVVWSLHHRDVFLAAYNAPSIPYGSSSVTSSTGIGKGGASTHSLSASAHHLSTKKVTNPASSMLTPRSGELQADGLVLIWNVNMPSRPEHVLTAASPIVKARWVPNAPHLVIGGCASGQIVVWDLRGGARYPVQVSALSGLVSAKTAAGGGPAAPAGHVHPICGMEVTDGGAGLVTASSDGRLNFWSMSNLREPVETVQVPGGVSSLAVAPESENLVLGDEQGNMYVVTTTTATNKKKARRKQVRKFERNNGSTPDDDNKESSSNNDTTSSTSGHFGMVTSVATRLRANPNNASTTGLAKGFCRGSAGLILTTGVDWTTQLWAPAYTDLPLMSWTSHSYDSFADVQWNPQNPGIFATACTNGTVGLWNLAQSLDESLADGLAVSYFSDNQGSADQSNSAENHDDYAPIDGGLVKLAWSLPDGRRLAVAAGGGRVHLLTLDDSAIRPKGDEDSKIISQLVTRGFLTRP